MVWLIISFPLVAVIAGTATYIIADRTRDGLVVDDYYRRGKEINLDLARDRAAADHGLSGRLELTGGKLVLQLHARQGYGLPDALSIRWLHATRSGFDRQQTVQRHKAESMFRTDSPDLAPGHWYVQIEAQDWRLQGSLYIPQETSIDLRPAPVR